MFVINWLNVVLAPLIAASFAYDIYAGNAAGFAVWWFAFLGVAYGFFASLRDIVTS